MSTQRTTHLELLAELRREAIRLDDLASMYRSMGQPEAAAREAEDADAAWGSYYELRAGTQ